MLTALAIALWALSALVVLARLLHNVWLYSRRHTDIMPPSRHECIQIASCMLCPVLNTVMAGVVLHEEWRAQRVLRRDREKLS